ncbi:hypothetical protein NAL32_18625 [Chryseobacterium sp. Ch-15]|uniref:Tetratricopeptide repeat protein n=1 Tax=Chryseobacterium muglaense TaxID=2893752 RepID=A0A9Q3UX08_9FLAO|nr:hypothetical protein [Chryseobacterium muglaense]MBD3906689.1 hypothetical protein [Chryseobacterium muglaense]MCC9036664.1 hypothetical protein [Chryseobacterium muglaense]MCM2556406.1 hypothetical protein [Chryseobacterium muglaense]
MKKLAIFTAILLSSIFSACGFYPYGEDIRFYFLNPNNFSYQAYSPFYYSSLSFEQDSDLIILTQDNEKLWRKYCNNKVLLRDISTVLKDFSYSDIQENSPNLFLRYLYSKKDIEAINYLKFAKNCEYFNTWQDDPWERNENTATAKRDDLLNQATILASKSRKADFKKRYAFLALRLAFYNKDMSKIEKTYRQYFSAEQTNDVIDIWALYFKAISEKNPALMNLYFAKVFAASPEKRFVSWQYFSSKVPESDVLNLAKNRKDKANVLLLYGLYNPEKNLENIKQIYAENSKFDGLSFLLYRELGKLEDWVFTPYYSLFSGSTIQDFDYSMNDFENRNTLKILERSEIDREYAKQVLEFIDSADLSKVENPNFWKYARAELLLMTKNYSESLSHIAELENVLQSQNPMRNNVEIIKALNLFANQTYGNAKIPDAAKDIIVKNKNNKHFIFALGRELEYLGNTDDAAILYASLDNPSTENIDYNMVYYQSLSNSPKTYGTYYYEYFDYLDAVYSPEQLQSFITKIEGLHRNSDSFYSNFYSMKPSEIKSLYDLLGTKYIRQNKLNLALNTFNKLGENYFDAQYSLWERDGRDGYYSSGKIFNQNPFYHLKYTPDFIPEKEHFRINKISVTKKLIEYLNKANNPKEKDRDYYYFLVANCYYNMSQYGNAWMMRRYSVSSEGNYSIREDNKEFNTASLAKFYYGKALENAQTDKFKALCLRMQGRCENYNYDFIAENSADYSSQDDDYENQRFVENKYYQDLKSKYSGQYKDMISGCESFKAYLNARR